MTDRSAQQSALSALSDLPKDEQGPVFAEPWQAQIFSITCALYEHGAFTWGEWAEKLAEAIQKAPDDADYYLCWLTALENMTRDKNILAEGDLTTCKNAWDRAARATPHGMPIELGAEKQR